MSSGVPLLDRAAGHGERPAVADATGEHGYDRLEARSRARALQLLDRRADLEEARVAFLFPPGFEYVVTQWAIWRAGGIAVPLSPLHPGPELEHILDDAGAGMVVTSTALEERVRPLAEARGARLRSVPEGGYPVEPILPLLSEEEVASARWPPRREAGLPELAPGRRAMILYTSGTTGRPKGVVTTHGQLDAQIRSLVEAWEWTAGDRILHVLPLHHTHGIVNALACGLYAGATVEMPGGFDPAATWEAFASGRITLFMAVPTMYAKLLAAWEEADDVTRRRWTNGARGLRLMVSGSAALPVDTFERWEEAAGHRLLERYGMTEIGMALSNPLHGERRPGTVGHPLPGVEVRLVAPEAPGVLAEATARRTDVREPGVSGEIRVRGPGVFLEYWGKREETTAAFTDGWFLTGDEGTVEEGYWRILGRRSVDIVKSGGYKVSALEIEAALRAHPSVDDCAVVGVPDPEWGEVVCAAVVSAAEGAGLAEELSAWLRERLAPYKLPRRWAVVECLPRNAMGKVRKPALRPRFEVDPER